jgi:hypothetical protein
MRCGSGARRFWGIVEGWIREPPPQEGAGLRRQIESARKLYREGQSESLLILYSYGRTIAGDDMREQVRFALQDLPPLHLR